MLLTRSNHIVHHEAESDELLIERAKLNPEAFEVLYRKYYAEIFRYVHKKVQDQDETADIVSRVFIKSYRTIEDFQYKGLPYSAWLYRVAINETNQYFRKNKTRHVVIDEHLSSSIAFEINLDSSRSELIDKLPSVLNQLKPDNLELIELRYFEGLTFRQISEIMNLTETNCKVKTFRALKKLKKLLSHD
ncbi:MAG: RNA polymerase sigma factor [Cyclobacteriaceae bacterium]